VRVRDVGARGCAARRIVVRDNVDNVVNQNVVWPVQENGTALGRTKPSAVFDLMTWVDSVTTSATWTTTQHDDVPPTVTDHGADTDHQHLTAAAAAAVATERTAGYFDDCASVIAADFRSMSNHCWTGNGSGFDASSLVTSVVGSHNFWTLLLLVFPVLTVFGNVLVVLGVYRDIRCTKVLLEVLRCTLAMLECTVYTRCTLVPREYVKVYRYRARVYLNIRCTLVQ